MEKTGNIQKLADHIRGKGYRRIAVDGTNGAGKSTVSADLANELGFAHINLDEYLDKNKGGFLEYLQYDDVKKDLLNLDGLVLDGICLLKVLDTIDMSVDVLVYVKRMRHGLWADESECEIDCEIEEFIAKEKEIIQLIERTEELPETLGLAEEIIRYHAEYEPYIKADITYERKDD